MINRSKFHDPNNTHYAEYKKSKRKFRNDLDIAYDEYMNELSKKLEDSLDTDNKYVWAVLKGRRKRKPLCRELKVNGKTNISNTDKCDAWAEHFETIYQFDSSLTSQANEIFVKSESIKFVNRRLKLKKTKQIMPFTDD